MKAKSEWREQSLDSNIKRKALFNRQTGMTFLLIVSFFFLPFSFPKAMQKTEDRVAMAATDFPKLVDEYMTDLYSRHPNAAAATGLHAWDGQLEDYSSGAISAEVSAIKKFQSRLEKIPPLELGFSDLFDYQILASNMKSRLLELEQIKSHERNPSIYNDAISTGLLQIASFEHAPADSRIRHIIAKEKQVPRLLDAARANVNKIPAIYLKVALESFKGTLSFIQSDLPKAFASVKDAKLQNEFKKSTKTAADAVAKYIKQLEKTKPDSEATYSIGKQNYEAKLRFDEGIEIPVDTLLKIAYRELAKTQDEFRKTAARVDSRRDAMAVWAQIQNDHPKAGTLVEEARKQLATLVRFIEEKHIVTLPAGDPPVVAPTPDFARWSTASMSTPGPLESRPLPARYMITDVDPKWSDKEKEEYLASFNYGQLWTTSIHEAYPGHYVQGAYLKQVNSPVRKSWAIAPGSFVEGWAHYTEQMMLEEGFGNNDPKIKMGQLADALLRLCRFVVGIREHTEGLTVEQGTIFFMQNAFMGETPSRLEAERGTFDPTYLVYTVGKLAILKLRDDYKRYRKEEFSLQDFHDRLLSNGNAPLWVHRQMLMPGDKGKLIE
ncbi:MAG TPA: DUF885 domain-containing protein [Blastocatellia bacterium]|nr:DUF885 domain-containing protein [Blastocatellia bacterium]